MMKVAGQRVTVMGLGRFGGGIAVARWLAGEGAKVTVTDQATAEQLSASVKQLEGVDVNLKLGGHDAEDFSGADLVVASPAVPTAAVTAASIRVFMAPSSMLRESSRRDYAICARPRGLHANVAAKRCRVYGFGSPAKPGEPKP